MSAASKLLLILKLSCRLLVGMFGWVLIAPIVALLPRRRDWIAVIGRDDGKLLDNTKYFFLQASEILRPDVRVAFVTERNDVQSMLAGSAYEVVQYPSWRGVWFLLRCSSCIVDTPDWFRKFRRFLLVRAKFIQLWHGVGFKYVELDKWKNELHGAGGLFQKRLLWLRLIAYVVTGRLVRYDVVNSTSEFYRQKVFSRSLFGRYFLTLGYPRNTFGELGHSIKDAAWVNVDTAVKSAIPRWIEQNRKIVLVTPTFRGDLSAPISGNGLDMPMRLDANTAEALDAHCEANGIEFVFKFHPFERNTQKVYGKHLHLCGSDTDIYPLLPLADAMVTDYSSIYTDYLLIDRPIIFYVPDLAEYTTNDRAIQFDFHEMTPGPKLTSWPGVIAALTEQWREDNYVEERARLRRLAFDDLPQDQAVPKLIEFMREKMWIPVSSRTSGDMTEAHGK
ncbi:MAG: CDP-glycerol glycerophosphotransferase family protein [Gammaproteobacteria bacterium]